MPELPEVETVRRGLAPAMEGARIASVTLNRPDLRFPFAPRFAEALTGARIESVGRRAKYLVIELDNGRAVIAHLGMTGSFRIERTGVKPDDAGAPPDDAGAPPDGAGAPPDDAGDLPDDAGDLPGVWTHERSRDRGHDHAVLHLAGGTNIVYNDPRRFGFMLLTDRDALHDHPSLRALGIEPTGNGLSGEALAARLAGRRTPLKAALMDQRVVAGLGNIYVCEALWRAGLSPKREAGTLARRNGGPTVRAERLAGHIRDVIGEAIEAGGSTLRDYVHADGTPGAFQLSHAVYDREHDPCRREGCRGTVRRTVQSGRSTFHCPECQR